MELKEEREITLYLQLTNGKQENTFDITSNQAITNSNFVIDYSLGKEEVKKYLSSSNLFDFYENIFIGESEHPGSSTVTLQPNETKKIPIKIKIPSDWKERISIGGINVTRRANDKENEQSLLNIYSSAFAVILQSGTPEQLAKLNFSVGDVQRKEQFIRIKNNADALQQEIKLSASVKDNKGKIYSKLDYNSGTVVPYADVNLPLQMKKELDKGKEYKLNIEAKQGEKIMKENYLLKVDNEGAVKVVALGDRKKEDSYKPLMKLFVGSVALIIVLLLGRALNRRKEKR